MKMITGDNVVSFTEDKSDSYVLVWPAVLVDFYDNEEGKNRIRVEPYASHVKGHTITVAKTNVLFTGEPTSDLKEYYEKTYGNLIPPLEAIGGGGGEVRLTQQVNTDETFRVEDVQVKVEHESGV